MILSIDVGKGTEDVICWDGQSPIENSIQLVLPSTAQLLKDKISKLISPQVPLYFTGDTIAGEPWHKVVYDHCAKFPGTIIMDYQAARSLRYNLNQVRSRGIHVVEDIGTPPPERTISLEDIYWERLIPLLNLSGISASEIETVLLCSQDHGEPADPERSARDFRMTEIYRRLDASGDLCDLMMDAKQVPPSFPRLQSMSQHASHQFPHADIYVMDSSPAVILGTMEGSGNEVIINVGNGHTVVMLIENGIVIAVYEHHSGFINREKIKGHVQKLLLGNLSHNEILEEHGHGVYRRSSASNPENYSIKVIGPNRMKISGLGEFSHPGGNMMMAGPLGLLRAFLSQEVSSETDAP